MVLIEVVSMIRVWKLQDTVRTPRRAVLFLSSESSVTGALDFYSHEAPEALRPKLRLTYVTSVSSGRP